MLAVFKREFKSYFTNPLGFTILAVMYFFSGLFFKNLYAGGSPYVESVVLSLAQIPLIFLVPVITMRLFSDERRQKTDQVLFTAPVKLINIVLGKFFAALSLYAMGFLPTLAYQVIVSSHVKVNNFYYIYALIGMMLFGAALIAVGMFVSALTESTVTSTVFTLIVNVFIMFSSSLAALVKVPQSPKGFFNKVWAWILQRIVDFLNGMDFFGKLESFGTQMFVFDNIVYFITISIAFIFLTERVLEKRRWS